MVTIEDSHDDMIKISILETLEERYSELTKDEKDALIMMYIESDIFNKFVRTK